MTALPGQPLTEAHREAHAQLAIPAEYLDADPPPLIRSVTTAEQLISETPFGYVLDKGAEPSGVLYGHRDLGGTLRWRLRLDTPPKGISKYLGEKGNGSSYNVLTNPGEDAPVWIIEGERQAHAVAATVGDEVVVIGIPGCTAWSTGEWSPPLELTAFCDGRAVTVGLDADAATNAAVYTGGEMLLQALSGAASVRFLQTPGGAKTGLDDYLGALTPAKRAAALHRLAERALPKPAQRRPKDTKASRYNAGDVAERRRQAVEAVMDPDAALAEVELDENGFPVLTGEVADGSVWFGEDGEFAPETLGRAMVTSPTPVAIAGGSQPAIYRRGAFRTDDHEWIANMTRFLGDKFRRERSATVREVLVAQCLEAGRELPHRPDEPYTNTIDVMVDLRTFEPVPHSPRFKSRRQFPIRWEPDVECSMFLDWLTGCVGEYQVPLVGELLSQVLDESQNPSLAFMLMGPNRSGKSTLLRIVEKLVGGENAVAAVTPQQLAENDGINFATAEVFGKSLILSADVPNAHIPDFSVPKRILGDDPITTSKKYGGMLTFKANALMGFSANTLPTVAAKDAASYLSKVVPIAFPKSFAGQEDPEIERKILRDELPGIFTWLARCRQARLLRGESLKPHPAVYAFFAGESDRLARFASNCLNIGIAVQAMHVRPVSARGDDKFAADGHTPATKRELFAAAQAWAEGENAGISMHLHTFLDRIGSMPGVQLEVRDKQGARYTNIAIRPEDDWGQSEGYTSLIPHLFPDEATGDVTPPSVTNAGPQTRDADDEPGWPQPTALAPAPDVGGEAVTIPTISEPVDLDTHPALARLTPGFLALLGERAVLADGPADTETDAALHNRMRDTLHWTAVNLTLADAAGALDMPPLNARMYIRNISPWLESAGVWLRERRLERPGGPETRYIPEFMDKAGKAAIKKAARDAKAAYAVAVKAAGKAPTPEQREEIERLAAESEETALAAEHLDALPLSCTAYAVVLTPAAADRIHVLTTTTKESATA